MEDWQKDFLAIVETVTLEVEQFFQETSEAFEIVVNEVSESLDILANEVQNSIIIEIDDFIQDLFEPIIDNYTEFDNLSLEDRPEETEFFVTHTVNPTLTKNPACLGCRYYHGQVYGGNLLVCGMHPYGWDDDNCPDWEES